MVKSCLGKEDQELSNVHTQESQIIRTQSLSALISHIPKPPKAQRLHTPPCPTSRKWSQNETALFYQSLRFSGVDFAIMAQHATFSGRRSQRELSSKFKKERRVNPGRIEKVLQNIEQQGLPAYQKQALSL